jgi:hypothetical protein
MRQTAIADAVGLTQPAVSKILRRVATRRAAECGRELTQALARLQDQLQLVVREAFEGYTQSQRDRTRKRERRQEPGDGTPPTHIFELLIESRSGDPRFLQTITHAIAAITDLHKLIPPAPPPTPPMDLTRLSPEEWALLQQLHARATGLSYAPTIDAPTGDAEAAS